MVARTVSILTRQPLVEVFALLRFGLQFLGALREEHTLFLDGLDGTFPVKYVSGVDQLADDRTRAMRPAVGVLE